MVLIAKTTNKTQYNDKVVVDIDDNVVVYYDFVYDIFVVSDIKTVFDKDKDYYSPELVYTDKVIKGVLKNKYNIGNNKNIALCNDMFKKINDMLNIIKNEHINNDIETLNDINKYVKVKGVVNGYNTITNIDDDTNKDILILDKDIDIDRFFIKISMSKDTYNLNYYDILKFIKMSYIDFEYDNKTVNVLIDTKNIEYVLKNINYCDMPLSLRKTLDLLYKKQSNAMSRYIEAKDMLHKNKGNKRHLLKVINAMHKKIKDCNDKIDNIYLKVFDIAFIKQYIVKSNKKCYYQTLNDITSLCYKSFKYPVLNSVIKDIVDDIDKNNVNNVYKYTNNDNVDKDIDDDNVDKDIDDDNVNDIFDYVVKNVDKDIDDDDVDDDVDDNVINDFVFNLDIDRDFNFSVDFDIDYSKVYDDDDIDDNVDDFLKVVDFYVNYINLFLKDISYNTTYDISKVNINRLLDFDLKTYVDNVLIMEFLNTIKDFIDDLNVDNDNDDIDDYDIYHYDIFKTKMNKHNSRIVKKQSDFLKVAFNEDMDKFYTTD